MARLPISENEAPRSKLRGILRNSQKPLPSLAKAMEGSPRLAYSAEAAASATKVGSYGVFGEGE